MWNAIYVLLYLKYDIDKEFMQQFEENADELLKFMRLAPIGKGTK